MNVKLFRSTAIFIAFALSVTCFGFVSAFAAEDTDKWDDLAGDNGAYMKAPYTNVEERIYADGNESNFSSDASSSTSSDISVASMRLFYKNNEYAQYIDEATGELICLKLVDRNGDGEPDIHPDYKDLTVYDLDGEIEHIYDYTGYWCTNPFSIGSVSSTTAVKAELYSQLIIDYSDNGVVGHYYSFEESAMYNQISVSGIKNGTRVEYTIGQEAIKYLVPYLITEEKWNQIRDWIINLLQTDYGISYDQYLEYKTYSSDEKQDLKKNDSNFYFSCEGFAYQLENFEAYYQLYDTNFKFPDSMSVVKSAVEKNGPCYLLDYKKAGKNNMESYETLIKRTDKFDFADLDEVHAETGYTVDTEEPASFKLAIEYTIDEYGLLVRCSAGNIRFDSSSFQLDDVHLLPFANAGNTNNDGFVLSPDGSGAVIYFDDAASEVFTTVTTAYGQDYTFSTISGANNEVARLPVYGISETYTDDNGTVHNSGFLAYVEEGESLADITISSSGTVHPFIQAYTKFNPRPTDQYSLSGGISSGSTMWTVEAKRKYTRDYKVRMFILDDSDVGYSKMASVLRDYLTKKGVLNSSDKDTTDKTDIPLVLETLGAIESTERVLGVPVSVMKPLTTFDDIKTQIIDKLSRDGINNIVIKMNGWLDGGLDYTVPNGVDAEDVLGGNSGFKDLVSYCKNKGVTLYPDFDFTYSHADKFFDGFDADDDLAKTIDDRKAYKKEYDPIYQTYAYTYLGVISTNRMMHFYDETYSEYKGYNVGAISVSTLGAYLNSDFNEDDPLNREDSKVLVDRLLKKIESENDKVLLSGGNIYTVKYADLILDAPLEDSMLRFTSASVPFYSMVIHGSVEYAGTALNLAGDYQKAVLKTIESGAVPYFVVAVQNASELKNNDTYSKYYSVRYGIWLNDIYDTYMTINSALSDVRYQTLDKHEFLDSYYDIVRVTYSNGVSFVINYGDSDFTYYDVDKKDDFTVKAGSFIKFDSNGQLAELS